MKIDITEAQLKAIINLQEDCRSMLGGGDSDKEWIHNIGLIDRMLVKNKLKEKVMIHEEESEFYKKEFLKQIEYNQFLAKQLSDLHLLVMNRAYYQAGGIMMMQFNPEDVESIVYRHYENGTI